MSLPPRKPPRCRSLKARSLPCRWPTRCARQVCGSRSGSCRSPSSPLIFGRDHVFTDIAIFFSKLAIVTFGGAYSVLAYMAQQAVETYGWLSAGEMLDGLGLAETTPGPLILVTEFVGFLAGYRYGGDPKLVFGLLGAAITLWATFAPCFLWIFAGAPYIERLSASPRLAGALSAVTAAVVGVILNLSLWFALHVFFAKVEPVWHRTVAALAARSLDARHQGRGAFSPRGTSAAQAEARHCCHARDFRGRGACLVRAVWNVAVLSRAEPRGSRTAPAPTCRDGPNRPARKAPRPRCRAGVSTSANGARTYVAVVAAIISGAGLLHERGAGLVVNADARQRRRLLRHHRGENQARPRQRRCSRIDRSFFLLLRFFVRPRRRVSSYNIKSTTARRFDRSAALTTASLSA